jgi:hypothetical protein
MSKATFYQSYEKSNAKLIVGQVQSGKTRFMLEKAWESLNGDFDAVVLLGGGNNNLFNQTKSRFQDKFPRDVFLVIDVKETEISEIRSKKTLIRSLKSIESMKKVLNLLENSTPKRIVILDDESDFGGINGGTKNSPTAIHNVLAKIFNLKQHYVELYSVTATPYADVLSNDHFEFIDIELLKTGEGYFGLKRFLDEKKYIVENVDKKINGTRVIPNDVWTRILFSHIKKILKGDLKISQLLLNIDLDEKTHESIKIEISNILRTTFLKNLSLFQGFNIDFVRAKIEELLTNIFILNMNNSDWNKNGNSIIIGGHLVSRGYTFEKLYTTVMFNEPNEKNAADTLLQRARWFGYRNEIIDDLSVYMSEKTLHSFEECLDLQTLFYEMVEQKSDLNLIAHCIAKQKFEYIVPTRKRSK